MHEFGALRFGFHGCCDVGKAKETQEGLTFLNHGLGDFVSITPILFLLIAETFQLGLEVFLLLSWVFVLIQRRGKASMLFGFNSK